MPSRKVTIAAGRPASVPSTPPCVFLTGCGQVSAARRQMLHQAEKERQVVRRDALFIQREDEMAGRAVHEEIGILDALGDALVGQQFADARNRRESGRARRRRRRYRRPSKAYSAAWFSRSGRGSGKNMPSSAAEMVSTLSVKRCAKASRISSTRISGAEAPAVTPSVLDAPQTGSSRCRRRAAPARRRGSRHARRLP